MAVMKKVERGELDINKKLTIIESDVNNQSETDSHLSAGTKMTVLELLRYMIKYSSNTAKNALKRQLESVEIDEVFNHVGIPNPYQLGGESNTSVRQFTRLFKALYFSTYLAKQSSELILELATETRTESLIAAGVPWEVQVAHKYGEGDKLLHDCGIVYALNNPYFLCIMTNNMEYAKARTLIKQISAEVYSFVKNQ